MTKPRAVLATLVLLLLLQSGSALAAPKVDGVFDLPNVDTNGQLTVGPDGNVWVALSGAVGRVKPDGTVTEFTSADLGNTLGTLGGGITAAGGAIWVSNTPGGLVQILPGNPPTAAAVAVTDVTAGTTAMATDHDGNVWVAQPGALVRFDPKHPATSKTFTTGLAGLSAKAMTVASDGTLWVTDAGNVQVLSVTTAGTVTPYPLAGMAPAFIGSGANGQVAFSLPLNTPEQIGLLSPGDAPKIVDDPTPSDPQGVAFGADGAFWIAEFGGNRLDRMTGDGQLTPLGGFPAVVGQGPRQIVAAPGDTLWTTIGAGDPNVTKIARITGVDPPPTPTPTPVTPTPVATPAPADTTAPRVTSAALAHRTLTAGTAKAILRFTVSEPGTAKLVLTRQVAGRRSGSACVAPRRSLRRARACTRLVRVRTTSVAVRAGRNTVGLKVASLVPGRYSTTLTVTDAAGNRAAAITRSFTITRRSKHR